MQPTLARADNGRFYIHYRSAGRSCRKSTGTADEREAQHAFGRWLLGERDIAPEPAGVTFAEIWPAYVERQRGKPTETRLRGMADRLLRDFGGKPVKAINQALCDAYGDHRFLEGAAPATVRLELSKVAAAINHAVKSGLILEGERCVIDLPPATPAPDRWLTKPEAAALLREADARTRIFLWIALATGARRNAIETLEWDQVDFETMVIHLLKAGEPQTSKKRVSVPMSEALAGELQHAYTRGERYVLGTPREAYTGFMRAAKAAGLNDVSPHTVRHTAATWMARQGTPLWKIAGILGNSTAMVERTYAKHCPNDLRGAVEGLRP
jgi:integrase